MFQQVPQRTNSSMPPAHMRSTDFLWGGAHEYTGICLRGCAPILLPEPERHPRLIALQRSPHLMPGGSTGSRARARAVREHSLGERARMAEREAKAVLQNWGKTIRNWVKTEAKNGRTEIGRHPANTPRDTLLVAQVGEVEMGQFWGQTRI